ncbi:RimK family alpha-L-glutamate ligase [Pedobacter sp. Leaf170]|uniref:ATP-grasp domain-containing protein n=1 Tax=Pedobacter sp. Leaf170 TaxID=2876558 RepID=UPI001E4723F5|nr:hypothetical protein [Pedobacter sp. Leaf170]
MKKIGILFGQERSFPEAVVERINQKAEKGITAEAVKIEKILQNQPLGYSVIIDRISQDVPFYRASLKNAAITGTAVINNPFWWSADEKFFNNSLAEQIGVPVPKTALIPSRQHPTGTTGDSFSNLTMPLNWDEIFDYVGFPAYMKPFDGGGWRDVYKLHDKEDFFDKHSGTEQLVMLLQEEIIFDEYFRVYCIGGKHVRIMQYDPRNPHHLRYAVDTKPSSEKLLKTVEEYTLKLCQYLGYDFNTVEFAVRDGVPIAIDFCNPAPDADIKSVGQENFDWVVETTANYAIERAKAQKDGQDNLTWGEYIKASVAGRPLVAKAATKPAAKKAPEKTVATKASAKPKKPAAKK